jgi:glycosyltransferase involved in cell wall biosynthesis
MEPFLSAIAGLSTLQICALVFSLGHALFFGLAVLSLLTTRTFEREPEPVQPARWPRLSVVIAARDEAGHLEEAVGTLLAQEYPDLEIILVDDRSVDGTGAAADRLAAGDARVTALHIAELPAGWLGKVNAHRLGTAASSGEWILYTDADVRYAPGTLRRSMALALERGLDNLVLLGRSDTRRFWLDVTFRAFDVGFVMITRAAALRRGGTASGTGGYSLVRCEALDRTPGFEWLKMEVADDVALARMLEAHGARHAFFTGFAHLTIPWYPSLKSMGKGLEKNFFAAAHYSSLRLFLSVSLIWALLPAPFIAMGLGPGWLKTLGTVALAPALSASLLLHFKFRHRLLPSLLLPAGFLLMFYLQLRAGVLCLARGGVTWRGTFYGLQDLRRGQRVKW